MKNKYIILDNKQVIVIITIIGLIIILFAINNKYEHYTVDVNDVDKLKKETMIDNKSENKQNEMTEDQIKQCKNKCTETGECIGIIIKGDKCSLTNEKQNAVNEKQNAVNEKQNAVNEKEKMYVKKFVCKTNKDCEDTKNYLNNMTYCDRDMQNCAMTNGAEYNYTIKNIDWHNAQPKTLPVIQEVNSENSTHK